MCRTSPAAAQPNTTHLEVVARPAPELLERICRVLRHRGATVNHLVARLDNADGAEVTRLDIRARVAGDVDILVRQLARLPDVHIARCRERTVVC